MWKIKIPPHREQLLRISILGHKEEEAIALAEEMFKKSWEALKKEGFELFAPEPTGEK